MLGKCTNAMLLNEIFCGLKNHTLNQNLLYANTKIAANMTAKMADKMADASEKSQILHMNLMPARLIQKKLLIHGRNFIDSFHTFDHDAFSQHHSPTYKIDFFTFGIEHALNFEESQNYLIKYFRSEKYVKANHKIC